MTMLLAEIHGHVVPEAENSEDYLTSAVFGHLRYLSPGVFWPQLFDRAYPLPTDGSPPSLTSALATRSIHIGSFSVLEVYFWPRHPRYGIPDLLLCFTGIGQRPVAILIEAKLWATKSGSGERDQLARYLKLLDDEDRFDGRLPEGCESVVVYLTERESSAEIEESLAVAPDPKSARSRIYRLCWQDLVIAAREALPVVRDVSDLILSDVLTFLEMRGLEYFSGFHRAKLPKLMAGIGRFYSPHGFRKVLLPAGFAVRKGAWVHE